MKLLVRVCHGRFHDMLPKEYTGTFPELFLEKMNLLLKEVLPNNSSQSNIVTHKTNTEIKESMPYILFTTLPLSAQFNRAERAKI
jgi:hypothetical protein